MLIAVTVPLFWALGVWNIKPTNYKILLNKPTNQSNKTLHISSCLNRALTPEDLAPKYI